MNGSLGISELEAARLRRQVDQIAHLVRSDEALPVPVFDIDRRGTDITLGAVKFKLEWNLGAVVVAKSGRSVFQITKWNGNFLRSSATKT